MKQGECVKSKPDTLELKEGGCLAKDQAARRLLDKDMVLLDKGKEQVGCWEHGTT